MTTTSGQSNLGSAPTMSRVEWAIARYNGYRACGLLDDLPQQTTEIATYQRTPDPPPPKPHLKWYPLSKPDDDIAGTYQQPVAITPRHRYSQTISTRDHAERTLGDDPSTWSHVDWAIARYNWYRACGLLDDSPPRTAEVATYRRTPDPTPPKPHLKWYPQSEPDRDVPTTYRRSVAEAPPASQRRYCQRVEHARARAMLARYQAEQRETAKGTGPRPPFVESDHNRVAKGSSHGGEFTSMASVSQTTEGNQSPVLKDKQQPSPADAERFDKILARMKALHPNEYAFFVAKGGSLADDGKTWDNWSQPLSWGEDNSVRIRSGAKSDFDILRFVINSIHRAPSYKPWLEAKFKSGRSSLRPSSLQNSGGAMPLRQKPSVSNSTSTWRWRAQHQTRLRHCRTMSCVTNGSAKGDMSKTA
jgi:hypothetical protein